MFSVEQKLIQKVANIYRLHELVDHIVKYSPNSATSFQFTSDIIAKLHTVAMENLLDKPGQYRTVEVHITNSTHKPPSWIEVRGQVESLCEYVRVNWASKDLVHLSAFVLWRLNWIHPFQNGNGRTSRAAAYLVLCAKFGQILPAQNSIIEQIVRDRSSYYTALRACDTCFDSGGTLEACTQPLELLLGQMLMRQLEANL